MTRKLPPFVTFTTGPQLLIDEGLVESITPDGLRYIARRDDTWPFGDEPGKHPYVMVGNARTMQTEVFLAFFKAGPPRGGRGPNDQVVGRVPTTRDRSHGPGTQNGQQVAAPTGRNA